MITTSLAYDLYSVTVINEDYGQNLNTDLLDY